MLIDVEGDPAAIDKFLEWSARGPSNARVNAVTQTTASAAGYVDFTIQRSEQD